MSKELPTWLTVQQVIDHTQLSRSHVYALVDEGEIPHRRFGTRIRIHSSYITQDFKQEKGNHPWPPKTLVQRNGRNTQKESKATEV